MDVEPAIRTEICRFVVAMHVCRLSWGRDASVATSSAGICNEISNLILTTFSCSNLSIARHETGSIPNGPKDPATDANGGIGG